MNRMLKLIFIVCLLGSTLLLNGQEVHISKSTDIIVLRGKSYYLHTVMPKETLYAICKVYEVSVEDVKALNEKTNDTLRLYEVLKIPFVEPFIQRDNKFYYHKVQQGETIYSIARRYKMKVKRLLKFNERYDSGALSIGDVLRLPLKDITLPKDDKNIPPVVPEEQLPSVEENKISSPVDIPIDTVRKDSFSFSIKGDHGDWEFPQNALDVIADSSLKVALLLPLYANAYPMYQDSLIDSGVKVLPRSEQFLFFYGGILLAIDSLKCSGYEIDLHVFDTERNSEKSYALAQELNQMQPDLIIGPVYASVYKVLADQLINKNIPLIYPLSTRGEEFGSYPNFVQVNASLELTIDYMLQWLDTQRLNANVLYLDVKGTKEPESLTRVQFKDRLLSMEGVHSYVWDMENVPVDSLHVFVQDQENIIVIPEDKEGEVSKVLPQLSALTDTYKLTVLGLPEWQTFSSIDHETFYKLNTKLFTCSYVDYSLEAVKRVAENYRKYFSTEPNTLVFKAFDMGLYFMKLTAQHREGTLKALEQHPATMGCSKFNFKPIPNQAGKENNGFYIVNFASDYQLKVFNF